jgi:GAF domain-containing protein
LQLRDSAEPLDGERSGQPLGPRLPAQLEALQTATSELTQLREVERLASVAGAAARAGLGAELLVVAIAEQDGRHLRTAYGDVPRGEARQRLTSIPLDGPSPIAQVARSGQPMYQPSHPDAGGTQPHHAVSALRPGTESVAALPLPATERPLGVIVVGRAGAYGFSPDDVAFLSVLAGLCALAVERIRLAADRSHVREVLRRRHVALHDAGARLRVGSMRIDLEQLRIEVDGRSAHLTPTEIRLLMFLAEEPGRPRTRGEILRHLWHTDYVGGERACDAHIWNLRRKIEREPSRPELVVTRRGVGYALEVT